MITNILPAEQQYMDVEKLINRAVFSFARNHNRLFEVDELKSEANIAYEKAKRTYNETKSAFSTWVYFQVWRGLQDYERNLTTRSRSVQLHPENDDIHMDSFSVNSENPCALIDFMDSLDNDCKVLADLVLNPPDYIQKKLVKLSNVRPRTLLKEIKQHLYKSGWTHKRTKKAICKMKKHVQNV